MAIPGVKYDDSAPNFTSNFFPVRGLLRQTEEADGAWLVAQRAEQRRRFKAVLCAKPKTYSQIKEERKRSEKKVVHQQEEEHEDDEPVLDGFYLMKHCCVDDPSDLCSINICGKGLAEAKEEDYALFDSVAYVNAGENFLPFEAFRGFPIIRELEMPLNGLRGITVNYGDFPHLEMLDLSYNNLAKEDMLPLGILPNLKVLHLTGNSFKLLPADLAKPYSTEKGEKIERFPCLEILMLDDNKLSDLTTFSALAGLRRLRHLNLEKNEIYSVPQLRLVGGKLITHESPDSKKRAQTPQGKRKSPRSRESSARGEKKGEKETGKTEVTLEALKEKLNRMEMEDETPREDTARENKTTEGITRQDNQQKDTAHITPDIGVDDMEGMHLPPPFPELQYLNLANNQIAEEEGLLAVAAWPMLAELVIHDNPLTTQKSGSPPLLTRFLGERLGINIVRLKPGAFAKPHIDIPKKPSRKVNSVVPPIPRVNVEELLAIEAPNRQKALPSSAPTTRQSTPVMDPSKPLPPISATPESSRPLSEGSLPLDIQTETEETKSKTEAWTEESAPKDDNGDAFFMTQVDEQEAEERKEAVKVPHPPPKEDKPRRKQRKVPDQFKDYELLFDADDDAEYPLPKDVSTNIRALKHLLDHPIVFRDNIVHLDKRQKPFVPYQRTEPLSGPPAKTQQEKVDEFLSHMKNRSTVIEDNLGSVLGDTKRLKQDYPEAHKLLAEIQRKYATVRAASMHDAREANKLLQGTMEGLKKS